MVPEAAVRAAQRVEAVDHARAVVEAAQQVGREEVAAARDDDSIGAGRLFADERREGRQRREVVDVVDVDEAQRRRLLVREGCVRRDGVDQLDHGLVLTREVAQQEQVERRGERRRVEKGEADVDSNRAQLVPIPCKEDLAAAADAHFRQTGRAAVLQQYSAEALSKNMTFLISSEICTQILLVIAASSRARLRDAQSPPPSMTAAPCCSYSRRCPFPTIHVGRTPVPAKSAWVR